MPDVIAGGTDISQPITTVLFDGQINLSEQPKDD
jgi:hypothetical protein